MPEIMEKVMDERELQSLEHVRKLLRDNKVPALEGDLAEIPLLQEIHEDIRSIRSFLYAFSVGDLSPDIRTRGILPGCLKALQAHLRHMIWQVQMVEQGDFSQQVQFMGEFSSAFNGMVHQLDNTLKDLKSKEETLIALTQNLQQEVTQRNSAVEALQESESRFKYLASHDSLTGALNRRSFLERASQELQNIVLRNLPSCIAMMDIDHFKRYNDTYGHLAGDTALRHVVKVVSATLRRDDFMGRYGGEEFVFFFHGVPAETGLAIAERIRESIFNNPVPLENGPTVISASFGLAPVPARTDQEEPSTIENLIHQADIALYQAKAAGRNRVISFAPRFSLPNL
jgi:diguanylate cyclase (GGDEF)-like protein